MSIFDNSLEPIRRARRKARERRELTVQNARDAGVQSFDHSPVSFRPSSEEGSPVSAPAAILLVHGFTGSPHSMRPIAERFMTLGVPGGDALIGWARHQLEESAG